jgi:ribulose-phosphate 3-epimerase
MDISPLLAELHAAVPLIGPSLLASDLANLQREIGALEFAGARVLHLDIMDGHFVPNLSFGLPVVAAIRRVTSLPLDVHLMIAQPGRYLAQFRDAGADLLTVHIEATDQPARLLGEIRRLGVGVGLALNPDTDVQAVEPYLDRCDLVLAMSVMPGFGGQSFRPQTLQRLQALRAAAGPSVLLSVDGGINETTLGACVEAGAQILVVGTGLFSHPDYGQQMSNLNHLARTSLVPGRVGG